MTPSSPPSSLAALPDTMPRLEGKDIAPPNRKGSHSLGCWVSAVSTSTDCFWAVRGAIEDEAGREWAYRFDDLKGDEAADLWNRTWLNRGYVLSPDGKHFVKPDNANSTGGTAR